MISYKEATKVLEQALYNKLDSESSVELAKIFKAIKDGVKRGETSITETVTIKDWQTVLDIIAILKLKGYKNIVHSYFTDNYVYCVTFTISMV